MFVFLRDELARPNARLSLFVLYRFWTNESILDRHHIFCFDFVFGFGRSCSGGFFSIDGEDDGYGDEEQADDVDGSNRIVVDGDGGDYGRDRYDGEANAAEGGRDFGNSQVPKYIGNGPNEYGVVQRFRHYFTIEELGVVEAGGDRLDNAERNGDDEASEANAGCGGDWFQINGEFLGEDREDGNAEHGQD